MSDATTIVAAGFTWPNFIAREDHSGIEMTSAARPQRSALRRAPSGIFEQIGAVDAALPLLGKDVSSDGNNRCRIQPTT
jgi:hypothetical protein